MALADPWPELRRPPTRISEAEMELYYRFLRAAARVESSADADSSMPNRVRDIADDLTKQFAFLSGGRGKDHSWIITFPQCAYFNQMPEEVVTKVLTYLTWIPRIGIQASKMFSYSSQSKKAHRLRKDGLQHTMAVFTEV